HVRAELVPVATAVPELLWQELWRADLGIAGSAHLGPDVVLQHPVNRVAARMPEHHARRIFLKVPELELYAEISVVEIVHGYVPCEEEKARTGSPKTEKAPSVAG